MSAPSHEFLFMNAAFESRQTAARARRGRKARTAAVPPSGYTQAARWLGVTPAHLWRVLNGERESAQLLKRYRALSRTHAA